LNLKEKLIGNTMMRTISNKIKDMHFIRSIDLSHNKFTDEGFLYLIKLIKENQISLEILNIEDNAITEKSFEQLSIAIKCSKSMKSMNLSKTGIRSRIVRNKLKASAKNGIELIF
jgi:Ran GTPase-activating protein (RanGAP) involved in mRNA processing and transport